MQFVTIVVVINTIRLRFDCNLTVLRPFDDRTTLEKFCLLLLLLLLNFLLIFHENSSNGRTLVLNGSASQGRLSP